MTHTQEEFQNAITQSNLFGIDSVYGLTLYGITEDLSSNYDNALIKIERGKGDEIFKLIDTKKNIQDGLILSRFKDQNRTLYYALFSNTLNKLQPNLIKLSIAYPYRKSKDQLNDLLTEFNSLTKVADMMQFWQHELGVNYIDFLENQYLNAYEILNDFYVSMYQQKESWVEINEWIIENYAKYTKERKPHLLLKINDLKKLLNNRTLTTKDKVEILYDELKLVEGSFIQTNKLSSIFSTAEATYSNPTFNADFTTYNNYYRYKKKPDYSCLLPSIDILKVANGKILAEYHLFIESLLAGATKKNTPTLKVSNNLLSIKQIALLLHICGFLESKSDIINKAKVLYPLLNVNFKDFYDALLNVNSSELVKTEQNLQAVLKYLEDNDIKAFKKDVISELKKASK